MADTDFHYRQLFDLLTNHCEQSQNDLFLVAPFIKANTLEKLLENVSVDIQLHVITRWRLDEILMGVSDIEVWGVLKKYPKASLKLFNNIHAKYYRSDSLVLTGSANLTNAALSHEGGNLEVLYRVTKSGETQQFEAHLKANSIEVTNKLYNSVENIVKSHEKEELQKTDSLPFKEVFKTTNRTRETWFPQSRNPRNLFTYYSSDHDSLTSDQRINAEADLAHFEIQKGFNKKTFEDYIRISLLQEPLLAKIDDFVEDTRRFGEMRNLIKTLNDSIDPTRTWQTVMRWLEYFVPDIYSIETANYSEIISKN